MPQIPAAALANCRRIWNAALPGTCQVQRKAAPARTATGGTSAPYANSGAPLACRVDEARSGREVQEGTEGTKTVSKVDRLIRLPYGSDVTAKDRLIVGAETYEVLATDADNVEALGLTAQCRRVK